MIIVWGVYCDFCGVCKLDLAIELVDTAVSPVNRKSDKNYSKSGFNIITGDTAVSTSSIARSSLQTPQKSQ
jgi:hydrogenase maturation factor